MVCALRSALLLVGSVGLSPPALSPWRGVLASRRRAAPLCSTSAWADYGWEDGLTCVEFEMTDGELLLGVYVAYTLSSGPHIRPLCASSDEDGVGVLLHDGEVPAVPLSAVKRVLDPEHVFVSERQAGGGQGLGNPHGEHGEECYDLRDVEMSPGVRVVVREGRDRERVL
jgi:hypothetical protein